MKKITFCFIIILINNICFSQDNKAFKSASLDFGMGKCPNLFNGDSGTSIGLFLYYSYNKCAYSLRLLSNLEYIMRAGQYPVESYSDISLMWGYKIVGSQFNGIIPMIGFSRVESIKRGKILDTFSVDAIHEKVINNTFGLSLGMRFLANTKHCGYSCYLFSNINSLKSYYGFTFCFGLGKFN